MVLLTYLCERSHVDLPPLLIARRDLVYARTLRRPCGCVALHGLPSFDDRAAACAADRGGGTTRGVKHGSAPLIVIASPGGYAADQIATRLRRDGAVVYATHSFGGCLRVATSVGPDLVLIDPVLPKRLVHLLRAHPVSARARIVELSATVMADLSHSLPRSLVAA